MKRGMRLTKLGLGQRLGWYWSSAIYGLFAVAIPGWNGAYDNLSGSELIPALLIVLISWMVGVIGLRFYVQDKDPTDIRSILGIAREVPKKHSKNND